MKPNLWIYSTPEEMRRSAASLIVFGAEVFSRAKIVKELENLKELKQQLDSANIDALPPPPGALTEFSFEYLVDCIRILVFFENYMKAELVTQEISIYLINKSVQGFDNLAKEQFKRPIQVKELNLIRPFEVSIEQKTIEHPALMNKTLGLQVLIGTEEYINRYNMPKDVVETIKSLNIYRNQLHFHNNIQFSLSDEFLQQIQSLKDFVQSTIKRIKQ